MFYSLDKLKPKKTKTRTKKTFFVVVDVSTFLYAWNREDKNTFFPPSKNIFFCPLYSKSIKKFSNFHLHQQKKFRFQFLVSVYPTNRTAGFCSTSDRIEPFLLITFLFNFLSFWEKNKHKHGWDLNPWSTKCLFCTTKPFFCKKTKVFIHYIFYLDLG